MQKSTVTMAVLALSVPLMAQQTITCTSTNGRTHFCPANTTNGVMLVKERSDNVCQQGSTWTYTRRGISVNGGCSADFQVGGSAATNTNGSYGNNGYNNNSDGNNNGGNTSGGNSLDGSRANGNGGSGQDSRSVNAYPNSNSQNRGDAYPNNNNQNNGNAYPNNNNQNNGNNYPNRNNQNAYPDGSTNAQGGSTNRGYESRQQAGPVIPSGTRMDVRLEQTVSPAEVNQGDLIPVTLVSDISVEGRVVAPAGTSVQAKVVSARGSQLDIRLDSMTVAGQIYRLTSSSIHSARESQATQSGNSDTPGQEIGSLIGALAGGARLQSGSVYTFHLTSAARPTSSN